ncbi:MAG: DUF1266 domain-containing protein [Helicobacteraceae bacterium]|jgi:hypothetical protein|nr:DUF1266 domain-containing protein [Helicobacteraceae bacterium]
MSLDLFLYCIVASASAYLCVNPNVRRFVKRIARQEFRKNPNAPQINPDRLRALSLGLICCEEIGAFADSLATGLSANRIELELKKWGVSDKAGAIATLNWLIKSGDRASFDDILSFALKYSNKRERREALRARYKENAPPFIDCVDRLAKAIANKRKHSVLPIGEISLKRGILAWDAGRLIALTRISYEQGYIEEETAWAIIDNAYDATIARYDDWREFANGYLTGAAMAVGLARLNASYSIAKSALNGGEWSVTPLKR